MSDREQVRKTMATLLKQPVERIKDTALLSELVTDSFVLVDMVVELQEEYQVRLTQEILKDVRTVGDLLQCF